MEDSQVIIPTYWDLSFGDPVFAIYDEHTDSFRRKHRVDVLKQSLAFDPTTDRIRPALANYLGLEYHTKSEIIKHWDLMRDKSGYRLLLILVKRGNNFNEHSIIVRSKDMHFRSHGFGAMRFDPIILDLYNISKDVSFL